MCSGRWAQAKVCTSCSPTDLRKGFLKEDGSFFGDGEGTCVCNNKAGILNCRGLVKQAFMDQFVALADKYINRQTYLHGWNLKRKHDVSSSCKIHKQP